MLERKTQYDKIPNWMEDERKKTFLLLEEKHLRLIMEIFLNYDLNAINVL